MTYFINYNGKYFSNQENIFNASNRAFLYGDGIFETIKAAFGKPFNIGAHYNRIIKSAFELKITIPENLTLSFLTEQITDLLIKNKNLTSARVRFTLFRKEGGLYQPESNKTSYLIECKPLKSNLFELNTKGLQIGIYDQNKKPTGSLSNLKSCNALIYIMAKISATENGFDDCIILNNNNNLIEATSSNLFLVKNNDIITPPLSEGCVNGTMRQMIIKLATGKEISIHESVIQQNDLDVTEEIFLTNAITGIKWVAVHNNKFFSNKTSSLLMNDLNDFLKK